MGSTRQVWAAQRKAGSLRQSWTLHSREWQRKAGQGSSNQETAQGKAE